MCSSTRSFADAQDDTEGGVLSVRRLPLFGVLSVRHPLCSASSLFVILSRKAKDLSAAEYSFI